MPVGARTGADDSCTACRGLRTRGGQHPSGVRRVGGGRVGDPPVRPRTVASCFAAVQGSRRFWALCRGKVTAHRIRLDVTEQQARTLARWCEAARLAWNWGLSERDRQYRDRVGGPAFDRQRGNWIPVGEKWQPDPEAPRENLDRLTTRVRREARPWWMVEPPARVYRSEFRTLDEAWRRCRDGLAGRPVPKGRATSFGLSNQDVRLDGRRVRLPKIGWLRLAERLRWRGAVKTVRVSFEAGRWYLALGVDWDHQRRPAPGVSAGLDVGVKTLAVLASADGRLVRRYANPRAHDALLRRLQRAGRAVSRKQKGSANWRKAVLRLARVHARIAAVRRDATEQVSTSVARSVRRVGIEDLAVRDMLRSPLMARRVADAAMSRLRSRVGVKVCEAGGQVLVASRFYASTRTCSVCRGRTGRIPAGQVGLGVRRWTCEHCGAAHDRTVNSARNLDPAVWSEQMDAAGRAESQNARGQACQSVSADGGGLAEAGSALARNPHAGAVSPRRDELVARHRAPG